MGNDLLYGASKQDFHIMLEMRGGNVGQTENADPLLKIFSPGLLLNNFALPILRELSENKLPRLSFGGVINPPLEQAKFTLEISPNRTCQSARKI